MLEQAYICWDIALGLPVAECLPLIDKTERGNAFWRAPSWFTFSQRTSDTEHIYIEK